MNAVIFNSFIFADMVNNHEKKLNAILSQSSDSLYKEFANHTSSTGNAFEIHSDDNNYIVSMHNITSTNWTVITYANRKDILAANGYQHVKNILFLLFILALLITSIIITIVISIKTGYLTILNQNINTMANGDFRVDFHSERKDEIGEISSTLNHFLVSMRNMLEHLTTLGSTLSNQITSSVSISESVGDNTIMQTRSLNELSSTVTELANAINDIAEGATNLSTSVNVTTKNSTTTKALMNTTIEKTAVGIENMNTIKSSMEEISTIMNELVETVSTVKTSSDQISNITQLISDIAGQTNLLSLNASIEAARAGESGRGFAVVASEIGNLAETSNRSASEIDGLIKNIMGEIQATLDKTSQSVSKINASSELVNNAYTVFSEISDSITESGHSVDSIINEITDVNDVATNMAAATEEQSAMSEEIAATAESLNSQSDSIRSNATQLLSETDTLKNDVTKLMDLISKYKF